MKIEGLPLAQLQKRKSTKWRDYGDGVLPLPVAEMAFEISPKIRKVLTEMIEQSDTGYLGSVPELKINFSKFALNRWGWKLENAELFTAVDVGVGMVEFARKIGRAHV